MNSEELEQSLRTEFESYLKNVVTGMRQEVSDFQKMVEAEFEKHKSQMDDAFRTFHDRFASEKGLDEAFSETVIEHLRLARDEGARITATAIAEAEELEKERTAATDTSVVIGEIRDAIVDISGKSTQSAILKSLVTHSAKFAPRGAFFILKNEHLVGWRVFGKEPGIDDKSVREVFFPVGNETLLGEAIRELKTVEGAYGSHSDDSIYLNRLGFGHPDRMYAIPLVVRERAVAVLYADYGNDGTDLNVEALESLVQVAGLTVEISASARFGRSQSVADEHHHEEANHVSAEETSKAAFVSSEMEEAVSAEPEASVSTEPEAAVSAEPEASVSTEPEAAVSAEPVAFDSTEPEEAVYAEPQEETEAVGSGPEALEDSEEAVYAGPEVCAPSEPEFETPYSFTETPEPETETGSDEKGHAFSETTETTGFTDFSYVETEKPAFETAPAYDFVSEEEPKTWSDDATATEPFAEFESASEWSETVSVSDDLTTPKFEPVEFETFEPQKFEVSEETVETSLPGATDYEFESAPAATGFEFEPAAGPYEPVRTFEVEDLGVVSPPVAEIVPEPVEVAPAKTYSRLSERNVDLPIEVSEDERRLHNDARRFARLLVSEIKLYNEQKVKEGRDANDLYEKLKEAIDRSREMYDKRVQPPVAAKFDYFHYELVSSLAEGDAAKLGASYPGGSA